VDRPFRCPFLPWIPIAGALVCLAQMIALPFDTWIRLIVWLAIGLAIYFFYGIRHSRLNSHPLKS
jgi:APA family basic amino acid/polyamine antiporter